MNKAVKDDVEAGADALLADSYCTQVEDFFRPAARDLAGRYLANFLDGLVITPTELMHSAKYQKRLHDAGRTMMNVVDKVGTLQARHKGVAGSQRVKDLHALITAASKKVWDDEKDRPPPAVTPETFADAIARLPETGAERDYAVNRILTEHLFQHKVWKDKVRVLVRLLASVDGTRDFPLVEALLAECLRSESALDQLLGMPDRLEDRCGDLVDLWKGGWQSRDTAADSVADIAALVGRDAAPNAKAAIEYSLMRNLAGKMPLRSAEPEQEIQAVFDMFRRMWLGTSLIGGAKALAMLEKRQARHINNETVTDLLRERKVLADRVAYLMVLAGIAVGPGNRATLKPFIDHYFGDKDFVVRVIGGQDAPVPKLQTLSTVHRALRGSWLAEDDKAEYAAKVETAQAELMKRSRLFEQVDRKAGGPAQKALTLVELCRKGTFIDGPNLDFTRKAITGYLQDPQFTADYLGGATGEERQRKILLLSKTLAGFGIRWDA
ncbi:MAG: hypothetical protein AB1918_09290 [Pseudomonadota bacterium]